MKVTAPDVRGTNPGPLRGPSIRTRESSRRLMSASLRFPRVLDAGRFRLAWHSRRRRDELRAGGSSGGRDARCRLHGTILALALTLGLVAPPAIAQPYGDREDFKWSFTVSSGGYDARYEATVDEISLGSGEFVDVRLPNLDGRHALLVHRADRQEAPFDLLFLDDRSPAKLSLQVGERIQLGPHHLRLYDRPSCLATPACADVDDVRLIDPPKGGVFGVRITDSAGYEVARQLLLPGWFSFGSSEDADVQVTGLQPRHARILISSPHLIVEPINGRVFINGAPEFDRVQLNPGDSIVLGTFSIEISKEPILSARQAALEAVEARRDEFGRQSYEFCHDEDFGENDPRVARELCALFDETTADVCPAAAESCPWGRSTMSSWDWPSLPSLSLPTALLRLVFFMLLAALVAWVIVLMVRSARSEGYRPEKVVDEPTLDLQKLPEARSHVLLGQADAALRKGDPRRAAILAHLAILRHLDDAGLARYHPSKTNGDYARSIRRQKTLHALFRQVSRQTERVRFGDGKVDVDEVATAIINAPDVLRHAHQPSQQGAELGIVGEAGWSDRAAGTGSVLLLLAFTSSGCVNISGKPYSSHAPEGMASLPALLEAAGLEVEIGKWKWEDLPEETGVVVLRTSAAFLGQWPDELQLDAILDTVPVVIIDDSPIPSGVLDRTRRYPSGSTRAQRFPVPSEPGPCIPDDLVRSVSRPVTMVAPQRIEVVPQSTVITSSISEQRLSMTPILGFAATSSTGGAAAVWAGHRQSSGSSPCVYVFANRGLLTNASLTRPENAAFAAAFFASLASPRSTVALVERLDDRMATDTADETSNVFIASNMLPFLLQTLVIMILVMIAVGAAFGPLRDPVEQKHKAFVEHAEALGRHYARAGTRGLGHSAQSLARYVIHENRERVRAGTSGGWRALVEELAAKHDLPPRDVLAALRLGVEGTSELGTPSPSDPPPHSEQILHALSRLLADREKVYGLAKKTPKYRKDEFSDVRDAFGSSSANASHGPSGSPSGGRSDR